MSFLRMIYDFVLVILRLRVSGFGFQVTICGIKIALKKVKIR